MHIGNRLKKIRSLKGLSQVSVCKGIVSPSHYSNIESGRYEASEDILELIAERLDVPSIYLTGVHKESSILEEILVSLDLMLNDDDSKKALQLSKEKTKDLQWIPSIQQEIKYLLLLCQLYLKEINLKDAKDSYTQLAFYINEENVTSLPSETIYKYFYVSALLNYYKRDFQKSAHLYEQALNYTENEEERGRILFNLALICYNTNEIQKGLYYALETKNILLNLHKWKSTVDTYILLGIFYIELNDFSKGKDALEKGLNLASEQNMLPAQARIFHNLGVIHHKQKDFDSSLENFQKSLQIKIEVDPSSVFISYLSLAHICLEMQDWSAFDNHIEKAETVAISDYDSFLIQSKIAKKHFSLGQFKQYQTLMEEALIYFYKHKYWFDLIDIAKEFSDYQFKNRRYKKAYDFLNMELTANKHVYRQRSN